MKRHNGSTRGNAVMMALSTLVFGAAVLGAPDLAHADFSNVSGASGLNLNGDKDGGLSWADLNNDGALDVVVNTNASQESRIFFNDGGDDPTFTDVTNTHASGLRDRTLERTVVLADFNNDGFTDLVRNTSSRVEVYFNNGPNATPPFSFGTEDQDANFVLTTSDISGLNTEGITVLDLDGDGWLDLVLDNHGNGFVVLANTQNPSGEFTVVPGGATGLPSSGNTEGDYSTALDVDIDGDIDLMGRKQNGFDLWLNQGDSTFQPFTGFNFTGPNSNKGAVAFCDFDNDGDFDFFYTDGGSVQTGSVGINRINLRDANGNYAAINQPPAPNNDIDGVVCGDVDNDGDVDLFLTHEDADFLYLNQLSDSGSLTFVQNNMNVTGNNDGEGATLVDYDNDGDLDLYINQDGRNQMWRNNQDDANHFRVRILRALAPGVTRLEIGAVVVLQDDQGNVTGGAREVNGGRGHGSQDPGLIHFGLPDGPDEEVCVRVVSPVAGTPERTVCVTPDELPDQTLELIVNTDNAPIANNDFFDTSPGQAATVDVTANDTDLDGDPLRVTAVTQPVSGSVVINDDGTVTYTPDNGFSGTATFSYTVSDDDDNTDTATVSILVATVYFTENFECSDDNAYGVNASVNGWEANFAADDAWSTAINGGVSTLTDNMGDSGDHSFGDPADGYENFLLIGHPLWEDYAIEADVRSDDDDAMGLVARFSGNDSYYICYMTNDRRPDCNGDGESVSDRFSMARVDTGTACNNSYVVANQAGSYRQGALYRLRMEIRGGQVTCSFDANRDGDTDDANEATLTFNDPNPLPAGQAGLASLDNGDGNGGAFFDNILIQGFDLDSDGDGIPDDVEVAIGSNPRSADTDGDSISDRDEALNPNLPPNTDANEGPNFDDTDSDGDGLTDAEEAGDDLLSTPPIDTDCDGLPDFIDTDSDDDGTDDGDDPCPTDPTDTCPLNDNPVANDDAPSTDEDTRALFDVLANDTDGDGDDLEIVNVTQPNGGTVSIENGQIAFIPNANFSGTATFTYTVSDGNGGTDSATVTVTVNAINDDPVASNDNVNATEDTPDTFNVLGNDNDVDGDDLEITNVSNPPNGTATLNDDGTITYTPDPDFSGADSFTYTVSDGNGGTDTATVNINVGAVNDAPVANDDAADAIEDGSVDIDVLANDTDAENNPLRVTNVSDPAGGTVVINDDGTVTYTPDPDFNGEDSFTYTISDSNGGAATGTVTVTVGDVNDAPTATDDNVDATEDTPDTFNVLGNDNDVDGDALFVASVDDPANGTASIDGDGNIVYTPDANYNGPDSFTYTVSDGNGGTDTATVNINVIAVNDAPSANDDAASGDEGEALNIDVLANDSDVDGDTLQIDSVTQPDGGTVTIENDGTLSYTPNDGFTGTDTFTYTVSDGNGGTNTATVTVGVAVGNSDPIVNDDTPTADEDTPTVLDVLDNDIDGDGDPLQIDSVTQPDNGAVVINDDGTITYTPDPDFNGDDTFTYTVSDGNGGTATGTVTVSVTPINDAPVAADDTADLTSGESITIDVVANDTDVDGDPLRAIEVTQPDNGEVTVNDDGTVTYTPTEDFSGTATFTYTVSDGNGGTATGTVTVEVDRDESDPDGDGIPTGEELTIGTDPFDADSDDDGIIDGLEPEFDVDSDGDGLINALDPDSDDDGILDGTETGVTEDTLNPDTDVDRGNFVPDADPDTTTNPLNADTDNGGIPDGSEDPDHNGRIDEGEGDPNDPDDDVNVPVDSDGDGLTDDEEDNIGTDPFDADSDDDGVIDGDEPNPSVDSDGDGFINALDPDSDDDGILDGTENGLTEPGDDTDVDEGNFVPDTDPSTQTSALLRDTDNGGVPDGVEDANQNGNIDDGEGDPNNPADDDPDTDGDGLTDDEERDLGTDPEDADSDDDGILDGDEGGDDGNPGDDPDGDDIINALDPDSDNDGILDGTENGLTEADLHPDTDVDNFVPDADPGSTTNPYDPDTDDGGVPDGIEDINRNGQIDDGEGDPNDPADDATIDTDGDEIPNLEEDELGTDPFDADSDDDGVPDGEEGGDDGNPGDDPDNDDLINALDPDSDDDGILDGTENGLTEPGDDTDADAGNFVADEDPTTTTDPYNPDTDNGGVPDGAEDLNRDGQIDDGETDPNDPSDDDQAPDRDGDGTPDGMDNCPDIPNADQLDSNGDGIGDACSNGDDIDSDGVTDESDNCPDIANVDQSDIDGDGIGDVCDDDSGANAVDFAIGGSALCQQATGHKPASPSAPLMWLVGAVFILVGLRRR